MWLFQEDSIPSLHPSADDSLRLWRLPVTGILAHECKVKWVPALTLKKHIVLYRIPKKEHLTFAIWLVSGQRRESPKWLGTLSGSGMWLVNGTCQLNLTMIFCKHDVEKMLMKSCLTAGTHLNRIKVICGILFSYTKSSLHMLTFRQL